MLFLHVPIWLIFLYSFTTEQSAYTFPPPGLTLKWVPQAIANPGHAGRRLTLTVRVAVLATVAASDPWERLAAAAVYRYDFFGKEAISFLLILPLALPGIVTGIAMRSAISLMQIPFSFWTIVIGMPHFVWLPFTITSWRVFAGQAPPWWRLPWTWEQTPSKPSGISCCQISRRHCSQAAILAFSLSFDEVIVTTFTAGQQQTLPIWIFSQMLKPRNRPITNVTAMLVVLITALPILLAQRLTARDSE